MLVLSRKPGERIIIDDTITLVVVEIRGGKVRIGIDAPSHMRIHRHEFWIEQQDDKKCA